MKRMAPFVRPGSQQGVGLIEVMIAVLVLAIGVLGVAAMQSLTLKNAAGSASRTQASIQIYSMMDIIRADRANVGAYNTNTYVDGAEDGVDGDPGTVAGWLDGLKTTVAPDAKGKVVCIVDTMTCTVGVQWCDANTTGGSSCVDAAHTPHIEITSRL
ncbi:type IV pilus modification protein PilV [Pseudoluteimonas lycopersici]|nr:type IV pilus modification protein PilV [Lysobacter lycopersici]